MQAEVEAAGYIPHIRRIREEKLNPRGEKRYPARRWVVERTLAWLQKCRAILIRYDKKASNYLGLLQLACALLWYRRLHRLREAMATQPTLPLGLAGREAASPKSFIE